MNAVDVESAALFSAALASEREAALITEIGDSLAGIHSPAAPDKPALHGPLRARLAVLMNGMASPE